MMAFLPRRAGAAAAPAIALAAMILAVNPAPAVSQGASAPAQSARSDHMNTPPSDRSDRPGNGRPEGKTAGEAKDKSAEKASGKEEDKATEKANGKEEDKSAEKASGKEKDKSAEKANGKEEDKAAESPPGKPDDPCNPDKMLVDFELRRELCKSGLKLGMTETSEVLANPTGGVRRGAIYEGLTDLNLGVDLRPTLHIRGNFLARAYQIHGRGLSANNLDNLNTASSIEASRTTRLAELWYEQHFDNWRLRIGQQLIITEFLNPESARLFVNAALGWPTLPSLDLPSGGPGYPLGTPAIRLRVDPIEGFTLFLALFNGDPTGGGVGGSQLRDASGTAFRTSDGAFVIGEIRYNEASSDRNGTYRFGSWWNSERFRDLRRDSAGLSLASPASTGLPRGHDGDFSFYGIVDQPFLFDEKEHTSFAAFARVMGAPGDRNLVDLYIDAGLVYKGPFGRPDDQAGLVAGYAKIGSAARELDSDIARLTGQFRPIRSGEAILELTYRAQVTGWLQLQPDFQYVFNPGGGIANPNAPGRRVGDAAIIGLRGIMSF